MADLNDPNSITRALQDKLVEWGCDDALVVVAYDHNGTVKVGATYTGGMHGLGDAIHAAVKQWGDKRYDDVLFHKPPHRRPK